MKQLIVLAVLAFAAWYGWNHYEALLHPEPRHQAVVRNNTGQKMVRVRLAIGGQTFVKEALPNGESAAFPFTVNSDSKFDLVWEFETNTMVGHWTGGLVTKGPHVGRHTLIVREGLGVIFESVKL